MSSPNTINVTADLSTATTCCTFDMSLLSSRSDQYYTSNDNHSHLVSSLAFRRDPSAHIPVKVSPVISQFHEALSLFLYSPPVLRGARRLRSNVTDIEEVEPYRDISLSSPFPSFHVLLSTKHCYDPGQRLLFVYPLLTSFSRYIKKNRMYGIEH